MKGIRKGIGGTTTLTIRDSNGNVLFSNKTKFYSDKNGTYVIVNGKRVYTKQIDLKLHP